MSAYKTAEFCEAPEVQAGIAGECMVIRWRRRLVCVQAEI